MTDTSDNPSDNQSLRYAINNAASNDQIQFNLPAGSIITLNSDNGPLTPGPLTINKNLTITGPGASNLKIDGGYTTGSFGTEVFSIASGATVSISGLTIADGHGWNPSVAGGGISNFGTLTVSDCTLSGNLSTGSGGGIANFGSLTVSGCTLSGNSTTEDGGGIYNQGGATVSSSTFVGNSASDSGGGIDNDYYGSVTVSGSIIIGNSASGDWPTGSGGGGVYNSGRLTISDSTLSGNDAKQGGGILSSLTGRYPGTITLTNATLVDNSASATGGGIYIYSSDVLLRNTLIAGNQAAGVSSDVVGSLDTSSDYNLIGDGSGGISKANHNLLGTPYNLLNPLLAPLANYGGPTQTMALLPGSPAIDAGSSTYAPATDQRGMNRFGAAPDIGAFESQGFSIALSSGSPQNTLINTAFNPLVVSVSANNPVEPVAGGLVTFTAPTFGASAVLSGSPASIDKNGNASVTATANGTTGVYSVTANAAGVASPVSFNLTNAQRAAVVVTTLSDENDPNDSTTSLREAIAYAETLTGPQTITFDPSILTKQSGNIVDLTSALPDLTGNIAILAPGANVLTVKRDPGAAPFSVFTVDAGATAAISGLTISGGATFANGGGILNNGSLTVSDCTLSGNTADDGGGIYNTGSLTVSNSTLSGNSATYGGGINNGGSATVRGSTLSGKSSFNNSGGIANAGSLTISDSTLSDNTSNAYGGGILNNAIGILTVSDCTLSGNSVSSASGHAGGGVYDSGSLTISDSTLSGNDANQGGGIYINHSGSLPSFTLTNDTLVDNSASATGGGVYIYSGDVLLHNSLIAGNQAAGVSSDVVGSLDTSSDYNLIGDGSGGLSTANQNLLGTSSSLLDPLLAPLGNYGGPTHTMALLPGSPAIDAGSSTYAPASDQRGMNRFGAAPDIGAFESQGFSIAVSSGSPQNTLINTAFNPLVVSVSANNPVEPVSGGLVAFTAPSSGASAILAGSPAVIDSTGKASVAATANGIPGTYTVSASASGVASPADFSLGNTEVVVTTLSDENNPNDGTISLREAIAYAESLSGAQTIGFAPNVTGMIDLQSALPDLTGNLTILGPGASILTVQRDTNAAAFSVFTVDSGATAAISGLTISGGNATYGGGILNNGTLKVSNSTLSGNTASSGGGIDNGGSLSVIDSILSGNSASNSGGGVYNSGTLQLQGVTVKSNEAKGANGSATQHGDGGVGASAFGGGLYVAGGNVSLSNDTLSGNKALGGGGLGRSRGSGGAGGSGSGGGMYVASGNVILTNTTLSGNAAQGGNGGNGGFGYGPTEGRGGGGGNGSGGGIFVAGGSVTLTHTTLSGNTANGGYGGHGGTAYASGGGGGGGGNGSGGGMFVTGSDVSLTNDTLSGNTAYGGTGGTGGLGETGFNRGTGGSGGNAFGGGFYAAAGSIIALTNDTLSGNAAQGGYGGNGGYGLSGLAGGNGGNGGNGSGGGLFITSGSKTTLHNTLIAENNIRAGGGGAGGSGGTPGAPGGSGSAVGPDVSGNVNSVSDYNLIGDGTGTNLNNGTNGDLVGTSTNPINPLLAQLANYGGPTQTMALLPGSPAIDAGSSAYGGSTDQRGQPRVGATDIGAFESQGFTLTVSSGNNQSTAVDTAFANPLVVTVTANNAVEPVAGGLVTFAAPTSGASAVLSGSPASIDKNGNASVTATANATPGSYTVTTSASGVASPASFSLGNTETPSLVVTTLSDENNPSDGTISLREAIAYAETLSGPQTITFDPSILTKPTANIIDLTSALPDLTGNITIQAPGASILSVQRDGKAAAFSVFTVDSGATAAIAGLTISGGSAPTTSYGGGGIDNLGSLTVSSCILSGNSAFHGGAINNDGALSVSSSILSGNSAQGGGGIANVDTLTVSDSTLSGNSATEGGGIDNAASLTVSDSTLSNDNADSGGGIYNYYGNVAVSDSTLSGNSANSGGAIFSDSSVPFTLTNVTLAGNDANTTGGGLDIAAGTPTLHNTILAGNTAGGKPSDVSGSLDPASDYNLVGDGSGGLNPANHNLLGSTSSLLNPLLAPLGNYGGPTQTMALLPGSPAIDAGDSAYGGSTDQRGQPRVAATDIGAFESQGFTISVSSGNNQNTAVNTAFANPLMVTVTANNSAEPVTGGRVTFTAPSSGASAVLSGSPASIDSNGKAGVPAAANATGGIYTVSASANGVASPANFSLSNEAPPSVSIMPLASVAAGSSVSAQGSFAEANGSAYTPYGYSWTATNSSGEVAMSQSGKVMSYPASGPASVPSFNFTPAIAGTYAVQLVVTDKNNLADSASQPLTVSSPVSPPPPPPSPITFPPSVVSQIVTTIELLPPVPQPEPSGSLGELFGLAYLLASAQSPQLANDLFWEQLGLTWELQLVGENVQMLMSIPQAVSLANAIDQNPLYSTAAGELLADVEMWLLLIG